MASLSFVSLEYKKYFDHVKMLDEPIIKSIMWYTSSEYEDFNKALREEKLTSSQKLHLKHIDLAFESCPPLTLPIIVYRGLKLDNPETYSNYDRAFVSTTRDYNVTSEFRNARCCVLQITISPGSKVLFIEEISENPSEKEVLLNRNGKFIVTGTAIKNNMKIIFVTYTPMGSIPVKNDTEVKNAEVSMDQKLIRQRVVDYMLKYKTDTPLEDLPDEIRLLLKRFQIPNITDEMIEPILLQFKTQKLAT